MTLPNAVCRATTCIRPFVLIAALVSCLAGLAPVQAQDAGKGIAGAAPSTAVRPYPVRPKGELSQGGVTPSCATSPKLNYYDGPVISNAQVVPVFWGTGVSAQVVADMPQFYADVTGSNWYDFLSEYASVGGTNQSIGRGTASAGVTINPSVCATSAACSMSDSQLQSELLHQISVGVLPSPQQDDAGHTNTVYMVHFPSNVTLTGPGGSGTSCQQFCAYHNTGTSATGGALAYGAIMDTFSGACSQGCGSSSNSFSNETSVASHELAEAVTDTEIGFVVTIGAPLAWYDPNCGEIGDICFGQNNESTIQVGNNSWTVQQLWSNAQNACVSSGPGPSFNVTAPSSATSGSPVSLTVTALNPYNKGTDTAYVGTVHFTSSDPAATLPADFDFLSSDQGSSTFSATFMTSGSQTITATDTSNNTIVGTSNSVSVASLLSNVITFTVNAPASASVGSQFTVAATASSGLAVVYTSAGACSNAGSTYTITASSGTCSVIANQPGNGTYAAAQTVTEYTTAVPATGSGNITLTSSADPSIAGKSVTFTATVTGTTVTPTGTVQFLNGSTVVATKTLNGGIASTSTKWLVPGSYTITAVYSGDANYPGGSSAPLIQIVVTGTTTTLTSSLNPSTYNQPVTFTAKVTATAGSVPDGEKVTFLHGSVVLGTSSLMGGVATFTTSTLNAGTTDVVAKYAGDSNYGASSSATLKQLVNLAATSTSLISSPNPSALKQAVTFTISVAGQYGGIPGGSVTIYDGAGALKTATLTSGSVSIQISKLASGSHNMQAVYKGTANFGTSTSPVLVQVVQ